MSLTEEWTFCVCMFVFCTYVFRTYVSRLTWWGAAQWGQSCTCWETPRAFLERQAAIPYLQRPTIFLNYLNSREKGEVWGWYEKHVYLTFGDMIRCVKRYSSKISSKSLQKGLVPSNVIFELENVSHKKQSFIQTTFIDSWLQPLLLFISLFVYICLFGLVCRLLCHVSHCITFLPSSIKNIGFGKTMV